MGPSVVSPVPQSRCYRAPGHNILSTNHAGRMILFGVLNLAKMLLK